MNNNRDVILYLPPGYDSDPGLGYPVLYFHDVHDVEPLRRKPDARIWLDIGTKEGRDDKEALENVTNARLLEGLLITKGRKAGEDLKYLEAQGAEHNERAWAARVGPMLEFLFPHK